MFKQILKVLIALMMSVLLMSTNVFAFHKDGNSQIKIEKTDGLTKKDVQLKYCTSNVKKVTIEEEVIQFDENKTTDEQLADSNKPKTLIKKDYWSIESYHSTKSEPYIGMLNIDVLKDLNIIDASTEFQNILSFYCLQELSSESSKKIFKLNEKVKKLYNEIAIDNGLKKASDPIGDEIFKNGIINIDRENLIYSDAQILVEASIRKQKALTKKANEKKKAQEEKNWIAGNKQPLLDEIDKKINGFDDQISKVNNDYKQLKIDYESFKIYFKEKIIEVEDLLEDVDRSQSELKKKAKELRSKKREFLSDNIIDDFKNKFKATKRVKAKNFPDYKKLEKLRDDVANAKKRKDFEKKSGFNDRWEILKTSKLNIKQEDKIGALSGEIKEAKSKITNNIDNLISEIQDLEEEFGSKLPWKLIIIGIIVLIIIISVGAYVYLNSRRIQKLQEEADKKVGSLKSDLEGRLKDTSEQIKSVGRAAARSGQSKTSLQDQAVEEKLKSPEEIIAAKYDELLSEYKEALEDFSKVATFKQKWHGLALSRKERQDGTKTILINSNQAFEKSGIWCVNFDEKYFAFPGSTVKSNMATYMNMEFMKAGIDFKGIFSISEGSSYSTEPCVLKRGGAGFSVERVGKIIFPN
jgi:hypothetical protein